MDIRTAVRKRQVTKSTLVIVNSGGDGGAGCGLSIRNRSPGCGCGHRWRASNVLYGTAMPIKLSDRDAKSGVRLGSRQDRAAQHATELAPIIAELRAAGVTSLYSIAKALNARGVPTATGKGSPVRIQPRSATL